MSALSQTEIDRGMVWGGMALAFSPLFNNL